MATPQEIEDQIRACQRREHTGYYGDVDDQGHAALVGGAEAAFYGLLDAWGTLRRALWSPPYRAWAEELKEECRTSLESLCAENRVAYPGEPDRWPATATARAVH